MPGLLPLLYNRRHLGVMMFTLALAHGAFSIVQFHSGGVPNPLVSVFVSNGRYGSVDQFPFQPFGFIALVILFLMAATSHDFWLHNLTAPVWKTLHMGVYAWRTRSSSCTWHLAFFRDCSRHSRWPSSVVLLVVLTLHVVAAQHEARGDREVREAEADGYVTVCRVSEIPEKRAKTVCLSGERVAVFLCDGKVSAISNVCQHQNGPLGEGRIVNGCVVCPWLFGLLPA